MKEDEYLDIQDLYEQAIEDAKTYGLGFFVIFKDGDIERFDLVDMMDLLDEYKENMTKA